MRTTAETKDTTFADNSYMSETVVVNVRGAFEGQRLTQLEHHTQSLSHKVILIRYPNTAVQILFVLKSESRANDLICAANCYSNGTQVYVCVMPNDTWLDGSLLG